MHEQGQAVGPGFLWYADNYSDVLLSCQTGLPGNRVNWCPGNINGYALPDSTNILYLIMVDEHPDSINDAAVANACTGADAPGTAQIIDFPANYHNGACGFNFADGHAEIHKRMIAGAPAQQSQGVGANPSQTVSAPTLSGGSKRHSGEVLAIRKNRHGFFPLAGGHGRRKP